MSTSAHGRDRELVLLEAREARKQKRYQSVVASIERCQRKLDKADKTVGRMVRTIAKLERQRKRLANAIEKAKPLVYVEQMAADVPQPPAPEPVKTGSSPPVKAPVPLSGTLAELDPPLPIKDKPVKRKAVKLKAETLSESCDRIVTDLITGKADDLDRKPKARVRKRRDADDFRRDMAAKLAQSK